VVGRLSTSCAGLSNSRQGPGANTYHQDSTRKNGHKKTGIVSRDGNGAGPNDVDPAQWASDLREIQRGNIGGVVDHMLNSPAFRYRFGFYYGR